MVYTPLTRKAMKLAYDAHHGQTDRSGVPYIYHPIHLAEQMTDEVTTCVALLHDVAEDTSVTIQDLEKEFPKEITEPLKLLTHQAGTDYFDYVRAICSDPVARTVKLADVRHNCDKARLLSDESTSKSQIRRLQKKYKTALKILEEN